ncbi:hypothetical protein H0H93_012171 [Arthromyces matolae]|nr:hypothetical protein H0H93_012171 [Arthromyces matolae]
MSEPPSLDDAARLLFKNCPDDVKERGLNSPEIFACLLHQNPYLFKRVKAVVTGNDSDFVHIWESCLREKDSRNRVPRFSLHSLIEADTKPSMLFYDLGSFVENPVLKERLQDLFIMGKDTFLVNASATGKTRLLFEGLFQHWGIYATACADQEAQALYFATVRSLVGERKMVQDLPETTALGYQMLLDDNNDCLNRRFSIVLLAHLYIFREFLKISHAKHAIDNDDLRKLWFLGQVWRSSIDTLSLDAHEELLLILEYRHTSFIVEELATVVEEIKFLLPQTIKLEGLFIAIDEAKLLMKPAWRDSAGEEHPLLRSLIRTWKHHLAGLDCPVTFIVAGIKIPMEAFPSSSPEWSGWRWTSNTGFFTPDGQRDYILPFFPPSFPETPSGKAFIDRVWKWCGSRHRLTACLIPMLIRDNFKHPHSVLDCYIQRLITYDATDGAEFVKKEGGPVYVWPFFVPADEIIGCDRLAQSAAHEVIFHYITTGIHPPFYGIDRINLVSCGIGQFKDAALQVIAMDQPGLNIAAAIWLGKDKGLHPWELFNLRWPNGDRYSSAGSSNLGRYFSYPGSFMDWELIFYGSAGCITEN